jgi:hypothetical protein
MVAPLLVWADGRMLIWRFYLAANLENRYLALNHFPTPPNGYFCALGGDRALVIGF